MSPAAATHAAVAPAELAAAAATAVAAASASAAASAAAAGAAAATAATAAGAGAGAGAGGDGGRHQAATIQNANVQPNASAVDESLITDFRQLWGLNEVSIEKLRSLPPALQQRAIEEFTAPPQLSDYNGKFIMHCICTAKKYRRELCRSQDDASDIALAQQGGTLAVGVEDTVLAEFIDTWALDKRAVGKLLSLEPKVQQRAMTEFHPPPHLLEVSDRFFQFCARMEKTHHAQRDHRDARHRIAPAQPRKRSAKNAGITQPDDALGTKVARSDSIVHEFAIKGFCAQWALNDVAAATLRRLHVDSQMHVMSEFDPPSQVADISGNFIQFTRSFQAAQAARESDSACDHHASMLKRPEEKRMREPFAVWPQTKRPRGAERLV